jgi:MFS family permease
MVAVESGYAARVRSWINRTVVGIVLATFFSDVGHEMVTAVLPLYLQSIGLGAAALGVMEGLADLLFSVSKLAGGLVGHRVKRKRPWGALGYALTTVGTGAMALVSGAPMLTSLRAVAWFGRGFRSPLRDFLLADAVGPTHFGRAYGVERASDMLGAVVGPLLAVVFVSLGLDFRAILLVSIVPSVLSVASFLFLTRDRDAVAAGDGDGARARIPRVYWLFVIGVLLFGLGDFSRTFLIWIVARAEGPSAHGSLSLAVGLYTLHNAVSAIVAYPVGRLGDHRSKLEVLVAGYALGVVTNALLAFTASSVAWLVVAVVLSGTYIAVEETMEKAAAAELLPRELRSLGFGVLACANAIGDMGSSVYVGWLLDRGDARWAFGAPAAVGLVGVVWMVILARTRLVLPVAAAS